MNGTSRPSKPSDPQNWQQFTGRLSGPDTLFLPLDESLTLGVGISFRTTGKRFVPSLVSTPLLYCLEWSASEDSFPFPKRITGTPVDTKCKIMFTIPGSFLILYCLYLISRAGDLGV